MLRIYLYIFGQMHSLFDIFLLVFFGFRYFNYQIQILECSLTFYNNLLTISFIINFITKDKCFKKN